MLWCWGRNRAKACTMMHLLIVVSFNFAFQLVHNGFVFPENNSDCLTLKLGISKNDALAIAKYNLLVRNSLLP